MPRPGTGRQVVVGGGNAGRMLFRDCAGRPGRAIRIADTALFPDRLVMTPAARLQAAIDLLDAVDTAPLPADRVAADYFRHRRYIGAKDRPAIAARLFGVLRRRARLDWWVARVLAGLPAQALPPPGRARAIADLALSDGLAAAEIRQLFAGEKYGPARPDGPERLLIDRLAGAAIDHPDQPPWVRADVPDWLYPALRDALASDNAADGISDGVPDGDPILVAEWAALRGTAPLDLRVNSLKGARSPARAALAEAGIAAEPMPYAPLGLRVPDGGNVVVSPPFRDGLVEIQDEGSQIVALLTDARPGMRVVDFCAGAGGKTLALAAAMAGRGALVACDIAEGRLTRARVRLRRAGVQNVQRRVLTGERDKWVKRHRGSFDRVLVDAPCTGTGTWRRNPDAKWSLTPRDLEELTALQGRILDSAARLVKPGGRMVYATCSLLPAENAGQIDRFLTGGGRGWQLVPPGRVWADVAAGPPPVPADAAHLTLTPGRHGTDGFFCAVLQRPDEDSGDEDGQP